jgi:hypothetical protein
MEVFAVAVSIIMIPLVSFVMGEHKQYKEKQRIQAKLIKENGWTYDNS